MANLTRRLTLYLIWGLGFFLLLEFVFGLEPPLPGIIALLLVSLGLLKDLYDEFILDGNPALYDYVEHNPLNLLLLWGITTGRYEISGILGTVVLLTAAADFLFDLSQDLKVEFLG